MIKERWDRDKIKHPQNQIISVFYFVPGVYQEVYYEKTFRNNKDWEEQKTKDGLKSNNENLNLPVDLIFKIFLYLKVLVQTLSEPRNPLTP
jgi:hypothetical protein